MSIHKLVFLSLFIFLTNTTVKACTCSFLGFCEGLSDSTFAVEARVINIYDPTSTYYGSVDVEIVDVLYGTDSLAYDTLTVASDRSSTCDHRLYSYVELGDSFVFLVLPSSLESGPEALFPSFELSICGVQHLVIKGDSITGYFDTGGQNAESQTLAYDYFKDNIDSCESLILSSPLPPFAIDLQVYPNPAQENLVVKTKYPQNIGYTIYSNDGRIMKVGESRYQRDFTIDIDHFSSGLYFLQLHAEGQNFSKKFIKI